MTQPQHITWDHSSKVPDDHVAQKDKIIIDKELLNEQWIQMTSLAFRRRSSCLIVCTGIRGQIVLCLEF